jgi:peptidoglycan/LPS O-acetylase OafA/YrhL
MLNQKRLYTLDALRGIASFAVCWFHLTNGNVAFLPDGLLKLSGAYGWLGVEVFFVISGFVIPYALYNAGYELESYGRFVLKRVVRLDPPYVAAIAIIILLNYLSSVTPGFKGEPFQLSLAQLLLHFGYLNVFFGYQWLNVVFWTLAIEFQYYLLIGLLFPVCASRNKGAVLALLTVLGALAVLLPHYAFIFPYLFLFLAGIVTFQYKISTWGNLTYLFLLGVIAGGIYVTHGTPGAIVGGAAALAIAFADWKSRMLNFLGDISYSLYLLHVPVGGRVINLSLRYAHSLESKALALMLALGVSIVAAFLLYRFVERPSRRWSSSISLRARVRASPSNVDAVSEPAF